MKKTIRDLFSLEHKVAVITGGAGLLGVKHAEIIAEAGGNPVLMDINIDLAKNEAERISKEYKVNALGLKIDITDKKDVEDKALIIKEKYGRIDILINNAANNPKVEQGNTTWSRFENFSQDNWNKDIAVGLTGAFFCSQVFGTMMAAQKSGVILNIASDLAIIAPDQRIYRKDGLEDRLQPVKPVTYSIVKSALIGLTKYLATYWADKNIRVNALVPGGVENNQPDDFVKRLTNLIPAGRMAHQDEYKGAVLFLVSDASSYMTGANLIIDGGRTCW
jgi:NAD(P)-dependent dehydrogenase (short-subunit alcohol dehydrogenase family)